MVSEMIRHGLSALLLKMHSLILMSICLLKIQWFLSTKQKNGNETSESSLIWLKYSCDSSPFLSWMSPNHIFDTLWLCWSLMFYTIIYKKKKKSHSNFMQRRQNLTLYEKRCSGKLDIPSAPSQAERSSLKTQIKGDYALENKMKFLLFGLWKICQIKK